MATASLCRVLRTQPSRLPNQRVSARCSAATALRAVSGRWRLTIVREKTTNALLSRMTTVITCQRTKKHEALFSSRTPRCPSMTVLLMSSRHNGKISKHLSGLLQHSVCIQRGVCARACHAQDCHVAIPSVGPDIRPLVSSLICQRFLVFNLNRSAQHASGAFSNDTLCAAGHTQRRLVGR